jgi:hypothetical protein
MYALKTRRIYAEAVVARQLLCLQAAANWHLHNNKVPQAPQCSLSPAAPNCHKASIARVRTATVQRKKLYTT